MKKSLVVSLLALFSAGCVYFYQPSEDAYNRTIASWAGRGTADLYAEWGYPQSSQSVSDNTFLETFYVYNTATKVRPIKQASRFYRPFTDKWNTKLNSFTLQPAGIEEYNCRTSFIIVNGVIVDYSYEGYGCVE